MQNKLLLQICIYAHMQICTAGVVILGKEQKLTVEQYFQIFVFCSVSIFKNEPWHMTMPLKVNPESVGLVNAEKRKSMVSQNT